MAAFNIPGPICVSTYPGIDRGTNTLVCTPPPSSVGASYKKSHQERVPRLSAMARRIAIRDALALAISLLQDKQQDLDNWDRDTHISFLRWFGTDTPEARAIIQERIAKSIAKLQRLNVDDFIMEAQLPHNYYAYVRPGKWERGEYERIVHLGPAFDGADSVTRAGTLVHEVSHFRTVDNTDDIKSTFVGMPRGDRRMYGYTRARRLASQSPQNALKNADNFEFFIEGHDPRSEGDFETEGVGDFPQEKTRSRS